MRSALVKVIFAAASLVAVVDASFDSLHSRLYRRQGGAFDPDETTAYGANCVEAFGPGYVECVPESASVTRLCIIPSEGETCCENKWGCPAQSFCLVQDLCCPDGLDPQTCANQNNVDLPPGFVPGGSSGPVSSEPADQSTASVPAASTAEKTTRAGGGGATPTPTRGSVATSSLPPQVNGAAREGFSAAIALAGLAAALI